MHPPENPREEPTSLPNYISSDSPISEPSHLSEPPPAGLPTEALTSIITYSSKIYSPSGDTPKMPYLPPYTHPPV